MSFSRRCLPGQLLKVQLCCVQLSQEFAGKLLPFTINDTCSPAELIFSLKRYGKTSNNERGGINTTSRL